jgi:hypothetical protein
MGGFYSVGSDALLSEKSNLALSQGLVLDAKALILKPYLFIP